MKLQANNKNSSGRTFLVTAYFLFSSLVLSGCMDSSEIQMVKGGRLSSCPDATVEEMVDSFLGSPSWQSGRSDDGQTFVNIEGDLTVYEKEVRGLIQFFVNADSGSFEFNAFELNGVPQQNIMAAGVLTKMCEAAQPNSAPVVAINQPNVAAKQSLYTRDEINGLINGASKEKVLEVLGRPDSTQNAGIEAWIYEERSYDPIAGKADFMLMVMFDGEYVTMINYL